MSRMSRCTTNPRSKKRCSQISTRNARGTGFTRLCWIGSSPRSRASTRARCCAIVSSAMCRRTGAPSRDGCARPVTASGTRPRTWPTRPATRTKRSSISLPVRDTTRICSIHVSPRLESEELPQASMRRCSSKSLPVTEAAAFAGKTFVLRIDRTPLDERGTLAEDLSFLLERNIKPIVVAPNAEIARGYVRALNRRSNLAVGLSGADAALLPAAGRVQTGILATLTAAGYIPVIEPTALGIGGDDVELAADEVAAAIAGATEAARALFFHESGGVLDPLTLDLIAELTPAEALALAERDDLDARLRAAMRAAAHGVRAGVSAAQILDGRIAHATIIEFITTHHLGTQVTGSVFTGTTL